MSTYICVRKTFRYVIIYCRDSRWIFLRYFINKYLLFQLYVLLKSTFVDCCVQNQYETLLLGMENPQPLRFASRSLLIKSIWKFFLWSDLLAF